MGSTAVGALAQNKAWDEECTRRLGISWAVQSWSGGLLKAPLPRGSLPRARTVRAHSGEGGTCFSCGPAGYRAPPRVPRFLPALILLP